MKFTVDRDVLADAVTWVARALPTRPPIPVLSAVRITADSGEGGVLTLSSFDYEVSARVEIPAEIAEPGTILVSGRLLADISRLLPPKPVNLVVEGPKAVVTCGSSKFTLLTMPLEDYPSLPAMPATIGAVDGAAFTEAVNQVTVAASRDETLPLLTGIRIEIEGENLTLLSTDRYRLALRTITWQPASPDFAAIALVRAKTLSDVAKSMGTSDRITIALADSTAGDIIGFEAGGRHTTSLLVDGDYPPVRKLLPESSPITAVLSVPVLTEAARRVSLVAERNTPIRMSLSEGQAVLDAGAGDDAQASEVIDATLHGDPISVAFNPQYLLDGLGALTTDFVRFAFTHPNKPVLFTGQESVEGEDLPEYQYLLVPIRFAG